MQQVSVDSLVFSFPDDWHVTKFDDWVYYRMQFQQECIKGIDLLAIAPNGTLWLIEGKDYRQHSRSSGKGPIDREIQFKVIDTLAALLPASLRANEMGERKIAADALHCKKIRIVFHCEQPLHPSKLFPTSFDPADVQQRLRTLLKAIDPHMRVVNMCSSKLLWTVR